MEESNSDKKNTPMGSVWLVVLGAMTLTALLLYGWHVVVYTSNVREHKVETAELRAELTRLVGYIDEIKKTGTSTPPAMKAP